MKKKLVASILITAVAIFAITYSLVGGSPSTGVEADKGYGYGYGYGYTNEETK